MAMSAEKEMEHIGQTKAISDHDHDLVHELSKRLDAVWRYDQYIANAAGIEPLQEFWRRRKQEDLMVADELKQMIAEHVKKECF